MSSTQKMATMALSSAGKLALARSRAKERMRYFTLGINSLVPFETDEIATMAVTREMVLLFNPKMLDGMTADEGGTVILHEYLHRYRRHSERKEALIKLSVLRDVPEDHELSNFAADIEINDDLIAAGCPMPSEYPPITNADFGLPPNLTYEEYVRLLIDLRNKSGKKPQPKPSQAGGKKKPTLGQGEGRLMAGQCGSGAGNAPDGEQKVKLPPDIGRTEVDQQVTQRSTHEAVRAAVANKSQGKVPLGIARFAEASQAPAKVDWRRKLAIAARVSANFRPGMHDYTYRRPARRSPPGMIMPSLQAPVAEVAFVFDTSGSMSDAEIKVLAREAVGILRAMPGCRITVISCDAKVHSMRKVARPDDITKGLGGGGGTDFRPAFRKLEQARPAPDLIVFGTDGYGTYPAGPPDRSRVIWLNVGGRISASWGEVIDIDREELR